MQLARDMAKTLAAQECLLLIKTANLLYTDKGQNQQTPECALQAITGCMTATAGVWLTAAIITHQIVMVLIHLQVRELPATHHTALTTQLPERLLPPMVILPEITALMMDVHIIMTGMAAEIVSLTAILPHHLFPEEFPIHIARPVIMALPLPITPLLRPQALCLVQDPDLFQQANVLQDTTG